ncbi:DUF6875 domain-containing protein [Streptomyces sp. NPDC046727]|uniref:DUF6875 domain-containing protein n=1 Tax=Streptomyces sp. NPDC046727 TaxID=3155373 RepID=UPI0033EBEFAE
MSRTPAVTGPEKTESPQVVADVLDWISGFIMQPHPDLGRKGAVCPFMDRAMKHGRVLVNPVRIGAESDVPRLRAATREWLGRIRNASHGGEEYESVVFVPFGGDEDFLRETVTRVQAELRFEALEQGVMVGEFYPGHEASAIHNGEFRPLRSPRPILGIRSMVETDIYFLRLDTGSELDRRRCLAVWHRFFGTTAAEPLLSLYTEALEVAA